MAGTASELIARSKKAQKIFSTFTQEQLDRISLAVCKAVYDNREVLSVEAVEETKMGTVENKIFKHANVVTGSAAFLKGKKSTGLIERDEENGVLTFAKPMGVIACVLPSTSPTTTACTDAAHALKGGNSVIFAPHPRAKKCTLHCCEIMAAAVEANGGPRDLVLCLENPTKEDSAVLMADTDATIATGGEAMVKAAYSSGRPSFGVGPGNVQTIFTEDYTEYDKAAAMVIGNRAYDNGLLCAGEQTLYLPRKAAADILAAFERAGGHIIKEKDQIERLRTILFTNGSFNAPAAGLSAVAFAKKFDIPNVPEGTRVLMAQMEKYAEDEILCKEILFPMIRFFLYDDFEEALRIAKANLDMMGAGHSSNIFSTDDAKIERAGAVLPVCRIVVNQGNAASAGNTVNNGLEPTMSMGCGTWGNNSISDNLVYKHLLNKTRVAYFLSDRKPLNPEEVYTF